MSMYFSVPNVGGLSDARAPVDHEAAAAKALDLSDASAVRAAHQAFVDQGPPERWDVLFKAPVSAKCAHAFATLYLRYLFDQAHKCPTGIPGDPEQAPKTLAKHLSPTGQAELLQSLDFAAEDNAFVERFTNRDRWCLGAEVYLARAKADTGPRAMDDCQQAIALLRRAGSLPRAAFALRQLGDCALATAADLERNNSPLDDVSRTALEDAYRLALEASLDEVDIRRGAGQPEEAASGLVTAGYVYEKLGQYAEAADCFTAAAEIYKNINNLPGLAEDAWARAGKAYAAAGRKLEASICYERAGQLDDALNAALFAEHRHERMARDAEEQHGRMAQLATAADACERVADLAARLKKRDMAAAAFLRLAGLYERLERSGPAREAYGKAAPFLDELKDFKQAAPAYWHARKFERAGERYMLTEEYDRAADSFAVAATEQEEKGNLRAAADLYDKASQAYEKAGMEGLQSQCASFKAKLEAALLPSS